MEKGRRCAEAAVRAMEPSEPWSVAKPKLFAELVGIVGWGCDGPYAVMILKYSSKHDIF